MVAEEPEKTTMTVLLLLDALWGPCNLYVGTASSIGELLLRAGMARWRAFNTFKQRLGGPVSPLPAL